MRTAAKRRLNLFLVLLFAVAAILILYIRGHKAEPVDPHAGQVYINDGFGMVWMTPLEGVEVNTLSPADFRTVNGRPQYVGDKYDTRCGIDLSEHQRAIDWDKVAGEIDFAYIRVGYRGNTEGGLYEDNYFEANMHGAVSRGIDVGVYFYSQAINVKEAIEEAEFVLERIRNYPIALPVVYDWEKNAETEEGTRTEELDTSILNDCAVAFCETIKNAGYTPCVYFNRHLGYYGYDLSRLTDYEFWVAVPGDFPDFYYACDIWQFSFSAVIPGIETDMDMNMIFIPRETEPPEQSK